VLFDSRFWPGLADGTVTVALRRWKRPTVKAGGTLQSPGGLLAIDEVEAIDTDKMTVDDARAAGFSDVAAAVAALRAEGQLYRVRFHRIGDDPRVELRQRADFDEVELKKLKAALARLPWADPVLRLIGQHPGVVSTTLATQLGMDRAEFKPRVRRLKTLGLTESLKVGYRLSPRGSALLDRLDGTA
jgi:hypothetical protein